MRGTWPAWRAAGLACVVAATLSGCTALPQQGPSTKDIVGAKEADPLAIQYTLLELTPGILARLKRELPPALGTVFREMPGGVPTLTLGVGDIVNVTLFEAAAGGLFIPQDAGARPGNYVNLPAQEVDRNGNITVPYAGQVEAAGRTLPDVQATIEERLRNRAIEPQAVVTLQEGRSSQISVTGEVNQSVRFSLSRSGDRILDAITRAGGPKYQAFESYVTLIRAGRRATTYFNRLVSEPASNIFLRPADTIIVSREFRSFMALGASGSNGQINFDNETLTLAQAVGKSGGILDSRGDPAQVFLYRLEPRSVVGDMGVDLTPFKTPMVPVIYRVNMREPDGFFLATKFDMRDQDILYVTNAASVDVAKFLAVLSLVANTALDANAARLVVR